MKECDYHGCEKLATHGAYHYSGKMKFLCAEHFDRVVQRCRKLLAYHRLWVKKLNPGLL